MVRNVIAVAVAASAFFGVQVHAQTKYFARVAVSGLKEASGTAPVARPVASCGPLVKGDWFTGGDEANTGAVVQTLSEAQAVCATRAAKGPGSCGWTGSDYYGGDTRFHVKWSPTVGTRAYNDPKYPDQGTVYAAACRSS
jgi:hypothetical protein